VLFSEPEGKKANMRKVKVAVIGLGSNGRQHAIAHAASSKSELVALCDRNESKLRLVGNELKVRKLFRDISEVLADPAIEAISIHTPDAVHKEPFLKALRAGKHLFVEKPLANTEADVLEMVEAAADAKRSQKIAVGFILRFNPVFKAIHDAVQAGQLGHVYYLEADYVHNLQRKKHEADSLTGHNWYLRDQIPMVSGGSHCIDLLSWIKHDCPKSVVAYSNHFAFPELSNDDCTVALFRFGDGTVAKVAALWGPECPKPPFYNLRVYGTDGTVERDEFCVKGDHSGSPWTFRPVEAPRIPGHPYEPEIEDWLTAIIEDHPVRTTLQDGANSTMAALRAVQASREGKEMSIPLFQ
jgi:predicted dehydrogenase